MNVGWPAFPRRIYTETVRNAFGGDLNELEPVCPRVRDIRDGGYQGV